VAVNTTTETTNQSQGVFALARSIQGHLRGGRKEAAQSDFAQLERHAVAQRSIGLPVDPKCKWEN
jgi:hypothetical protein